jgi:hypothetical protein
MVILTYQTHLYRYSFASSWPERIGLKELMFLWSLEVEFPHPLNTNTKEENATICQDNLRLYALESKKNEADAPLHHDAALDSDADDDSVAGGTGNTTSGGDLNSIENRLLISSGTQMREEMYSIEHRKKVIVTIDEPLYYEIFRQCHRSEFSIATASTVSDGPPINS